MSKTEILVLWLLNLLAAAGVFLWLRRYYSPAAREQRRRVRSHGRRRLSANGSVSPQPQLSVSRPAHGFGKPSLHT